jgi:hypothetical protein
MELFLRSVLFWHQQITHLRILFFQWNSHNVYFICNSIVLGLAELHFVFDA